MFKRKHFLHGSLSILFVASFLLLASLTFVPKAHAAPSVACPPGQSEGANNTWVDVIQYRLNGLVGYFQDAAFPFHFTGFPLSIDGSFGPATQTAVKAFQSYMGLSVDGSVGNQTWGSMGFCTASPPVIAIDVKVGTRCPGTLGLGSSGIWVQALQHFLNVLGVGTISRGSWFPLALDGSFGSQTEAAVKSFQAANHITQDGAVGPQTWQRAAMCY